MMHDSEFKRIHADLSSKDKLTGQEKRDLMLIDLYLRSPESSLNATYGAHTAHEIPSRTIIQEETGDDFDLSSAQAHLNTFIRLKKEKAAQGINSDEESLYALRLFIMEVADVLDDLKQYTTCAKEREEVKRIDKALSKW